MAESAAGLTNFGQAGRAKWGTWLKARLFQHKRVDQSEEAPPSAAPEAPQADVEAPVRSDTENAMREALAIYGARHPLSEEQERIIEDAPIVRLANTIIQQALKERASHTHIEPDRRGVRVRHRIDGVLHETIQMPKYIQAPLVGRYKVMAGMNLARYNVVQEGTIGLSYEGNHYQASVSCAPTQHGENIVMRIYDDVRQMKKQSQLGMSAEVQTKLEEAAVSRTGLILFVGPFGSG